MMVILKAMIMIMIMIILIMMITYVCILHQLQYIVSNSSCTPILVLHMEILHRNIICVLHYCCTGCGGTFKDHSGIITSPGYPGYYGDDEYCTYLIVSPAGGLLTLRTLDFLLEDCCDYVEVSNICHVLQYDVMSTIL